MTITIIIIVIIKNFVVFVLKLNIFQHLFIEWVSERKIQIFSFFNCLYTHLNKFCLSNPHIFRYLLWFVHQNTIVYLFRFFFCLQSWFPNCLQRKRNDERSNRIFFSCFYIVVFFNSDFKFFTSSHSSNLWYNLSDLIVRERERDSEYICTKLCTFV